MWIDASGDGLPSVDLGPTTSEFGFELGDWLSFFSYGGNSLGSDGRLKHRTTNGESYETVHEVDLSSGTCKVTHEATIHEGGFSQRVTLTPTEPIRLGDFVLRYRVPSSEVKTVSIDGKSYKHRSLNRYLQYNNTSVDLFASGGKTYCICPTEVLSVDGFRPVVYVRDEPSGYWIVHIRLLAVDADGGILRLYGGNRLTSGAMTKLACTVPRLRSVLRYCKERASRYRWAPEIPFQYVEYCQLDPGTTVALEADLRLDTKTEY